MYEFIAGKLVEKHNGLVVIETGGIGYSLKVSSTTYDHLPLPGEAARVFTHLHVREDIFELYGFATRDEREFYHRLIGISKVGPKAALAILSMGTPAEISNWILSEDAKTISKTPGIGPTTAKRIILELKPKLEKSLGSSYDIPTSAESGIDKGIEREAIMALEALGYARSEVYPKIRKILSDADADLTTEKLIKLALKK